MAGEIFISFASKDVKVAMTLCGALESRGFSCWISARDIAPGANFQSSIVRALRQARIMLLVFTANSNTSEEMTKELALASQQKITVIPLRVEDVTPNDAFAYEFATRQWIDAFADWEFSIDQLSKRIGQQLELGQASDRAPASPSAPAPEAPLEAHETSPIPAAALTSAHEKLQRLGQPEKVKAETASVAPPQAIEPEIQAVASEARPEPRTRGVGLPVAIAAGLTIVALVAAVSLLALQPRSGSDVAAASNPAPRLSTALVAQPQAPAVKEPPVLEAQPRLVKTNRPKPVQSSGAAPSEDIPY